MSMETSQKVPDLESGGIPPPAYASVDPSALQPPTAPRVESPRDYGAVSPTGPLPTYQDATDVHGPPPSYESLYGELRQVRSPRGFLGFVSKSCNFCCNTLLAIITIGIFSIIPVAMITVGSLYLHDCRAEPLIPIYLVVGGVFGLLQSILHFVYRARHPGEEERKSHPFDGLFGCFLIGWFIAGSVWIYRNYDVVEFHDSGNNNFCHPILYWFSFAVVTVSWAMVAMVLSFFCCCCCCIACAQLIAGGENN